MCILHGGIIKLETTKYSLQEATTGKTFHKPINLSNAKGGSADSQIAASGSNVYVTWWDNKTGDWQVF
jgi:hypothetical protein